MSVCLSLSLSLSLSLDFDAESRICLCEEMTSGGGGDGGGEQQAVFVELPAPSGWGKTFTPKNSGSSNNNEIIFIAPTGEKIVNRKLLQQYLRSHPSGLTLQDFDWRATGETPRRSARLSEKAKAVAPPKPQPKKKRARRSSSGTKENDAETEVTPEELHENKDARAVDESVEVKLPEQIFSGKCEYDKDTDVVENVGAENNTINNTEANPHKEAVVFKDEEGQHGYVEANKCIEEIKGLKNYGAEDEKRNATGVKSQNQMITADRASEDDGNMALDDWAVIETVEHEGDKLNYADDISNERPDAFGSEVIRREENELKVSPAITDSVGEYHQQIVEVGQQVELVKETKSGNPAGRDMDPKQQSVLEPGRIDAQKHLPPTLSY